MLLLLKVSQLLLHPTIMLKQLAAFIILIAFMAQTFNRAAVVADYYTNTFAYAKNCVNKAKPQLHCNGKCQMMKKLKEEEKKDQQNAQRKSAPDEVLSSKSFFAVVHSTKQTIVTEHFISNSGSPIDRASDFFHPPGA